MAKKGSPPRSIGPDWFLTDWMKATKTTQAELARLCGWSKATANDIVHGKTEYYRLRVNEVSAALQLQPWELLMHPDEANQIKRLRAAVEEESRLKLVAEQRQEWGGAPDASAPLRLRR